MKADFTFPLALLFLALTGSSRANILIDDFTDNQSALNSSTLGTVANFVSVASGTRVMSLTINTGGGFGADDQVNGGFFEGDSNLSTKDVNWGLQYQFSSPMDFSALRYVDLFSPLIVTPGGAGAATFSVTLSDGTNSQTTAQQAYLGGGQDFYFDFSSFSTVNLAVITEVDVNMFANNTKASIVISNMSIVSTTPEPSTIALLILSAGAIGATAIHRRVA